MPQPISMHPSWNDYPHLVAELDPNGNKGLIHFRKPISVLELATGTNKKLDWKCSTCSHEWTATGNDRTKGNGCPACAGRLHSDGRNSMAQTHPELAAEYQGDSTQIVVGTNKNLGWKCSTCEHEWKTTGNNRAFGNGCPACSNQTIHSDGRNSMAVTHPELVSEYQGDATKVMAGTHRKLPWKCSTCDHEWKARGRNRVAGNGCPACAGRLHSDGRNSMARTHPKLAEEYQGDATQVIVGTHKKLGWKCSTCEHEWKAKGNSRTSTGNGCPACATTGFKPDEPAHYYVHKILNEFGEIIMYKGGVSKNWQRRLSKIRTGLPAHLSIENIDYLEFEVGQDAWDLEQLILKQAETEGWKAPVRDFDGGTELFLYNPIDFLNLRSENE